MVTTGRAADPGDELEDVDDPDEPAEGYGHAAAIRRRAASSTAPIVAA
jgi:hypothetical protein